jgi:Na+-translocating ferredoxin:NAD+ oxidoreductase RnfG subunit
MCFQIYRQFRISILLALVFFIVGAPLLGNADETELPDQKLMAVFPEAKKFVLRSPILTPNQIDAIEKELGAKLLVEDQKPVFYIPISDRKKPMGLVLFANAEGPGGVIEGAVGLDMRGKVVKVEVYEHEESDAIAGEKFLKQFIGMDIDDAFRVGVDVEAVEGYEAASNAVALMPKKMLVMSYALFLKGKPKPEAEKIPEPDIPEEEMPEVEDLKALMALMIDDYFVVVDYFDEKESKEKAIAAAKRLARYAKSISNFEPPKNADQTEEYVYLQDKFSETLLKFAEALEKEGISDVTREQWDGIVELVNQAHLRFSEEEIDLDTY